MKSKNIGLHFRNIKELNKPMKKHCTQITKSRSSLSSDALRQGRTNLWGIDKVFRGLCPCEVTVIAGGKAMGKTTLISQLILNAASKDNVPAAVISRKVSKELLFLRLACISESIDRSKLFLQDTSNELTKKFLKGCDTVSQLPIYIDDDQTLSLVEMKERLEEIAQHIHKECKKHLGLIVVDEIESIDNNEDSSPDFINKFNKTLKGLKELARLLCCPVLATLNINSLLFYKNLKADEWLDNALFQARELNHVDNVILIHKDLEFIKEKSPKILKYDLYVVKQNNGKSLKTELYYDIYGSQFV